MHNSIDSKDLSTKNTLASVSDEFSYLELNENLRMRLLVDIERLLGKYLID
jgi:hypothetical protein